MGFHIISGLNEIAVEGKTVSRCAARNGNWHLSGLKGIVAWMCLVCEPISHHLSLIIRAKYTVTQSLEGSQQSFVVSWEADVLAVGNGSPSEWPAEAPGRPLLPPMLHRKPTLPSHQSHWMTHQQPLARKQWPREVGRGTDFSKFLRCSADDADLRNAELW